MYDGAPDISIVYLHTEAPGMYDVGRLLKGAPDQLYIDRPARTSDDRLASNPLHVIIEARVGRVARTIRLDPMEHGACRKNTPRLPQLS
jgi:hypothetical protein